MKFFILLCFLIVSNCFLSQNNEKTMAASYYTISDGNYSSNIWSATCHTCATCGCAPDCNIPPNVTIYIQHAITSTCTTLDIGSNSTFVLLPGGSFNLLGNGSITGTGSLTVNSGSSLTVTGNLALSGGGDATINGAVSVSGTISIGSSGSNVCGTGSISAGAITGSPNCNGVPFGSLIILPIELIEFTGTCIANGTELNWSTASEKNNDYFLVEKSFNGVDWQFVAKILGNGTSSSVNKYIHTDITNNNELIYYRLSQVDKNGVSEIFQAIDVSCKDNAKDQMVLYPNPSSTELNILLNVKDAANNGEIKVINNLGQIVMESKIDIAKGTNTFVFPIDISNGTYNILFSSDNIVLPSQKLIISR